MGITDIPYHYDGPHGMKSGAEKTFSTILERLFLTSGLDMDYFRRVTTNSNNYGQDHLKNVKFGGVKILTAATH